MEQNIFSRMALFTFFSSLTLTLIFKVKHLASTIATKKEVKYLPSNATIANVVLRVFDPNFQGQTCETLTSLKR